LPLSGLPENACIEWQADLALASADRDFRLAWRRGDTMMTSGDLWFWRDNERRPIEIEVVIPEGYSFSTPWTEIEGGEKTLRFRPQETSAYWTFRTAVGPFDVQRPEVAGTYLRVALIGLPDAARRAAVLDAIRGSAEAVAGVYGQFPQPRAQVIVVAAGAQRSVVPWAHVMRGGGPAIEFFLDENRPASEFAADWTATHEFSHLLLPYVSGKDRWFSEGLASYYQNVLRARDGRLSESQAWLNLYNGFERGKAEVNGDSLARATLAGQDTIMRVYWSGAALLLEADARLRAVSAGSQSLDSALSAFDRCCFDSGRSWRAKEIFRQLDRLTGFNVFIPLYDEYVLSFEFPDISEIYDQLGLIPGRDSMQLDPAAPWSLIRHLIMTGDNPSADSPLSAQP